MIQDLTWQDIWWAVLVGVLFLIPEVVSALDKKPGGTFSQWIWKIFALRPRSTQRYKHLRRATFGAFWAGLTLHLVFMTSVGPVILYAIPMVWSAWYAYKYETKTGRRKRKKKK